MSVFAGPWTGTPASVPGLNELPPPTHRHFEFVQTEVGDCRRVARTIDPIVLPSRHFRTRTARLIRRKSAVQRESLATRGLSATAARAMRRRGRAGCDCTPVFARGPVAVLRTIAHALLLPRRALALAARVARLTEAGLVLAGNSRPVLTARATGLESVARALRLTFRAFALATRVAILSEARRVLAGSSRPVLSARATGLEPVARALRLTRRALALAARIAILSEARRVVARLRRPVLPTRIARL